MNGYPEILIAGDFLERAEEFLRACRALPKRTPPDWPRYFMACHAVELALKAFLAARGRSVDELAKGFGHDLKKLLDEAMSEGLTIGVLARGELEQLNEAHTRFWHRYPKFDSKPVFIIDQFEVYIDELFRHVAQVVRP
jgi:HEPN domain-containing protein